MTDLIHRVELSLREKCTLQRGGRLLVAVSGGVDSMVLLHVLHTLTPAMKFKLAVAHFNHQLRGRSSNADATLVQKTAGRLGLPVFAGQGDVKLFTRKSRLSLEMAARKLRHEFLAATARERGFPTIALAHHADDQVELFFLRLLRGSGGEGLAGMKWHSPSPMDKRIELIRPLLDVPKVELEEFAREAGLKWRQDATNTSLKVPRNRVRNELLPLLRQHYQPGLTRTVSRVIEIVRGESELARDGAERWLAHGKGREAAGKFADLPAAVQRQVILMQLKELSLPLDFEWVEQLRTVPEIPVNVGLDLFAARDARGTVTLSSGRKTANFNQAGLLVNITGETCTVTFAGTTVTWEWAGPKALTLPIKPEPGREIFNGARFGATVELRHWQPGDRFQPLGMKSPVKLQDLFTNAKIPRERRRELLVATTNGEIFWVEGLRLAARFKVTPGTKRGLVWSWIKLAKLQPETGK